MLFTYHAIDADGRERDGTIEAASQDIAVSSLQRRKLVVSAIQEAGAKGGILNADIPLFNRISNKDVVILSRQIATLFEAQVSALRVFRLLAAEVDNKNLARTLSAIGDELQGGSQISAALSRYPKVFSSFYVNMVRAGEESGKLSQTFDYLADYLDRSYDLVSKAQNALIYPAFVVVVFFGVMWLMMALVIPKISAVLVDSGQQLPFFTTLIINFSTFVSHYSVLILAALVAAGFYVWQMSRTKRGQLILDHLKLSVPYIGSLYSRLYLARISDNFATMILSGVSVVEAIDITSTIVDNSVFEAILADVATSVKGGSAISDAFSQHPEIPGIMVAMTRVGEETGELGTILTTLSKFYNREVSNSVDTLVGLIEPMMIVLLGVGVGVLLSAILMPIYNLAGAM
jgi:type II secretory pathway component PulF